MTFDGAWAFLSLISLVVAFGFGIIASWSFRFERAQPDNQLADHGVVVALGLMAIALGSAATAWSTALFPDWTELGVVGGTAIRGALVVLVVYLFVAGPLRRIRK